jgi:hypothetical protein
VERLIRGPSFDNQYVIEKPRCFNAPANNCSKVAHEHWARNLCDFMRCRGAFGVTEAGGCAGHAFICATLTPRSAGDRQRADQRLFLTEVHAEQRHICRLRASGKLVRPGIVAACEDSYGEIGAVNVGCVQIRDKAGAAKSPTQ